MKEGDFILMDFVGRVLNTGEIFDLTIEKVAKEKHVHFEGKKYEPEFVIVGANMVVKGVDEQLLKMNIGETKKFEVPYADAFGKRNPQMIKIIGMQRFIKQNINPVPGAFVTIDGANAKIQSVSGGRVRVDFNNPLSGKDLEYEITIVKQITDTKEKVDGYLKQSGIETHTEIKEGVLEIKTKASLADFLQKMISETLKKWIKEIKEVKFLVEEKKTEEKPLEKVSSKKNDKKEEKSETDTSK